MREILEERWEVISVERMPEGLERVVRLRACLRNDHALKWWFEQRYSEELLNEVPHQPMLRECIHAEVKNLSNSLVHGGI